jgi:predicted Ser/Thr protein kinase
MECPDDNTVAELMQGVLSVERRREVEKHIDGCASCSSLLVGVGRTFEPGTDLPLAGKLGRYELVEVIGRGAMGSVYSARDPLLAREVALKILHKNTGNLDEARALARLAHPNVVGVYDVGEEDGRVWIAMERAPGETLGAWLKTEPRTWQAILDVFVQAARALEAAHAAGVVHGDFKPDNVLVDGAGRVKVTDFGLARLHDAARDDRLLAGTPAYMAPEMLEGGEATPASDQFALATTLHEALYGARAYAAPTMTELREQMRHARVLPHPPQTRGVPEWVFPIVARGVEIDPRFRFANVSELERAITRRLGGEVHYVVNAVLQLVMFVFHVAITVLFIAALSAPSEPQRTYPPDEARLHYISTVIAVWLAALFFFGWAPLGIFWTPINAYGLFRRRRWALRSTLIYAGFSIWTCLGTPFALYALSSLWPLRKNKSATSR